MPAYTPTTDSGNPPGRNAGWKIIVVMALFALTPCLAGNLDFVVPIITVFYLILYGTVNLACFFMSIRKQPNFR